MKKLSGGQGRLAVTEEKESREKLKGAEFFSCEVVQTRKQRPGTTVPKSTTGAPCPLKLVTAVRAASGAGRPEPELRSASNDPLRASDSLQLYSYYLCA